ncbi:MAG: hypothetical protein J6T25_03630 [Bacilli bacterium]|nr:hypothetical protein [Bacilli bacterium]
MKNKHIYIPLFIFLGAGLVSLIASAVDFKGPNKQLSYAAATVQFNHDGASDGLDPNGRSFDARNFMTDDVITSAFQKSELVDANFDVEAVKQYIAIENVVPKNIVKEINSYESILDVQNPSTDKITTKDYHPVRYRIVVYQDLGVSQGKLNELVKNLVDEYVAKFNDVYTNTLDKTAFDELLEFDAYDYSYQTQLLSRKISVIMNFGNELHARHNDFSVNDVSFRDLNAIGNQYIENLNTIADYINLKSVTKNPQRLKDYYNYQLELLQKDYDKYEKDLQAVSTELNTYTIDKTVYVANGETIVPVGNNSAETYDALVNRKLSLENTVASLLAEINDITLLRNKIDNVTAQEISNVTIRIGNIKTKYEQLEADFENLLNAYNAKYMGEGVIAKGQVRYQSSSLLSVSFIVHAIKVALPIMLITMLGISIYYLTRAIRKQKRIA